MFVKELKLVKDQAQKPRRIHMSVDGFEGTSLHPVVSVDNLEELEDCVSGQESAEDAVIRKETIAGVNRFLDRLSETERRVFVCRYWYLDSVDDIAVRFGFSRSKTTSMLHRIRGKLNRQLEKEGLK